MARSAYDNPGKRTDTSAAVDPAGSGPSAIMHLGRAEFTQSSSALERE
jgi:hypothetical protein